MIEKRLYNYMLEYHQKRPIDMKSLSERFGISERKLRSLVEKINRQMSFDYKIASRTKDPSGYYMAVTKKQQEALIKKQRIKAIKELEYLQKLMNETNTDMQLSFSDQVVTLERVLPFSD